MLLAPLEAQAWGDEGHEIIGAIANHFLSPAARSKVESLLAADHSGLTRDRGIATETTWADHYRDSDRNASQARYRQTQEWHYVDIEVSAPDLDAACFGHPPIGAQPASTGPPHACITDKIEQFSRELTDRATAPAERLLALQFLLHFIGDLHQPLHAADAHDRGGNDERVRAGRAPAGSLHHYWDTVFVSGLGRDVHAVAQRLIIDITAKQLRTWRRGTATDWAMQSFEIGRTEVYGRLPAPVDGVYPLNQAYVANATIIVRVQLERAGVRLAQILNRALAGATPST